MSGTKTQKI